MERRDGAPWLTLPADAARAGGAPKAAGGAPEATQFDGDVFGWGANDSPMGATGYTEWTVDGEGVAGMMPMDDTWPPGLLPHWMVYFAVADCDTSAARVAALGGTVVLEPTDIPPGRMAVCTDPAGAVFSILAFRGPVD